MRKETGGLYENPTKGESTLIIRQNSLIAANGRSVTPVRTAI